MQHHTQKKKVIGRSILSLGNDFKLIPTPGHTEGSMVAVLGNQTQILFSGDHLWWNPEKQVLVASQKYCWWNWTEQLKSVKKLLNLDIGWLLPGHGFAHQFEAGEWRKAVEQTISFSIKRGIS